MREFDAGPFTVEDYRDNYTRPVKIFYERLLGHAITDADWDRVNGVWHDAYLARHRGAHLTYDAVAAIERIDDSGTTQSLLSMWGHDDLTRFVDELGLTRWFTQIDGLRGAAGGNKAPHLGEHLVHLALLGIEPEDCVMIGDALDDAMAARAHGVACVLFDSGSHPVEELRAFGRPVAGSLIEALDLAAIPTA